MAAEPRIVNRLRAAVRPPSVAPARAYAGPAAFLVALIVLVVPAAAVLTGASADSFVAVAAAVYLLATVATGLAFEGTCAALFVITAFNTAARLFSVPWVTDLWVRIADVLVVATLGALFVGSLSARDRWPVPGGEARGRLLVVGSFAVFVGWSFLSAVVGNGPSSHEAFLYGVDQLRSLAVLVASALLVRRTDARCVLYPYLLGLGGTLLFAADEVFAGRGTYASRLGALGEAVERAWPSPSLTSFPLDPTVLYDGVPIGQSRLMVGLALVFVCLVTATATRSRRHAPLLLAAPLGLASVIASGSHAALMALYAAAAVFGLYWTRRALDRRGMDRVRRWVVPVAAATGVGVAAWVLAATLGGAGEVLLLKTDTLNVRLTQYAAAVDLTARYPLFGVGGEGNFRALTDMWIHNLLLANLVATGVPGFLAYATSLGTATWLAARRFVVRPADEEWLWVGVLASTVVFYVYTFWVIAHRWESVNAAYWIVVGVVVGTPAVRDGD